MWVWHTARILPDAHSRKELIAFCRRHRVTDLFCQIPYDYEDATVQLHQVEPQRAFNAAASAAGLTVHALDGAPDYVLPAQHQRMVDLIDALDQFNRGGAPETRYAAVHLDNEPYLLPQWRDPESRRLLLQDYIALNGELGRQARAADMEYGVDIPFWWDRHDATGKAVFVVPTTDGDVPLLEALFPLVQNIGIMSYRERVTGAGGVVACCGAEFALGARHGVDVLAAVELGTGPLVEPGISLGRYAPDYVRGQLATLERVLPHQKGCAGLAIHAYDYYRAMEERP
jgi:hypothetical protein